MKKLFAAGLVVVSSVVAAADQTVVDRYNRSCISCHLSGVANAPKTGSVADWKPRLAKGMDTLVLNVRKGLNAMPPRGMCTDCSDADYKALIQHMATPKQ